MLFLYGRIHSLVTRQGSANPRHCTAGSLADLLPITYRVSLWDLLKYCRSYVHSSNTATGDIPVKPTHYLRCVAAWLHRKGWEGSSPLMS